MKVVLINGSPHPKGCTYTALCEVERELNKNGVETEIIHIGTKPISGCLGCFKCREIGQCIIDDAVNETARKLAEADGMIFGSPVYFSSPNGSLIAFLDRLYASASKPLMYKPCGCIVTARRAGTTASLEALYKYPLINEQPIVSSCYWCMLHGNTPEEIMSDTEGLKIAQTLGRNMAWMISRLAD